DRPPVVLPRGGGRRGGAHGPRTRAPPSAARAGRALGSPGRPARSPRRGGGRPRGGLASRHRARGLALAQGPGGGDPRDRERRLLRLGDARGRLPRARPRARPGSPARVAPGRERRPVDVPRRVRGAPVRALVREPRRRGGREAQADAGRGRDAPALDQRLQSLRSRLGVSQAAVQAERHQVSLRAGSLALALHLPDAAERIPCVIACHGLSASKDSDKYLLLGAALPRAGLALARFDFRGCGESTGREDETTVGTRIDDVRAVLEFLGAHGRLDGRFGLLGSSLGGFVALHVAAERGDAIPVVTWNAPADLEDLGEGGEHPGIGMPFLLELATHRYAHSPAG